MNNIGIFKMVCFSSRYSIFIRVFTAKLEEQRTKTRPEATSGGQNCDKIVSHVMFLELRSN